MARFKKGQKLVCIHKGQWIADCGTIGIGPGFNEIVTVSSGCPEHCNNINLVEYPKHTTGRLQSFKISWFEPLVEDSVLYEELNAILVLD